MPDQQADVAIVGAGPVGVLVANLLAAQGLRVAVFERERTPHGTPRAFSCDDEALRIYQLAGLIGELLPTMQQCPVAEFADGDGRPFANVVFQGLDFGNGFHALNFFHQPTLEGILRRGLARFEGASLTPGCDVVALRETPDDIELTLVDTETHQPSRVRARYVLGCDGRKSTARKLAGIEYSGLRYEEPWIAISGVATHLPPTMPLVRFVCDPARPGFVATGAENRVRFEFMLLPGETRDSIEAPEAVASLMAPYLDPATVRIERSSVYTFEAKTARTWRKGRLFLLGDAAHTMPPFLGQGLVSGLRDAANLAWKLAFVLDGRAPDSLLDTYEAERRAHAEAMMRTSRGIGSLFLLRQPQLAALRDAVFRTLDRLPRTRRFVRDAEFKPRPMFDHGAISGGVRRKGRFDGAPGTLPAFPEGTLFPQPRVAIAGKTDLLLDDALAPGFAVLGRDIDPAAAAGDADLWARLRARFHRVLPSGVTPETASQVSDTTGALGAWFERYGADLVVLRPDRYVFGAVRREAFPALEADLAAMFAMRK